VNDELKIDKIYISLNAISFGGIEKIIQHHEYNITKIVSTIELITILLSEKNIDTTLKLIPQKIVDYLTQNLN